MFKKLLLIAVTLIVGLVAVWRLRLSIVKMRATTVSAQLTGQIRPFTALVFKATFLPGRSIPERTEVKTFAVRGDGSTADLLQRPDPEGGRKLFYIKKILDVPGKRKVVVDPFSKSTTTYPLLPSVVAVKAVKPIQTCEGKPAGEQVGYSVTETEEIVGPDMTGPALDEIRIHMWLAPQLNCVPIRRESRLFKGGKELQRVLETFTNIVEGEPDASVFDVPADFVERAPSAVMIEAGRRYPNVKSLQPGDFDPALVDEAYFHALQHHRQ